MDTNKKINGGNGVNNTKAHATARPSERIGKVVDEAGTAALGAAGTISKLAEAGGHRLQETATKAGLAVEVAATKVVQAAQQTAQRVGQRVDVATERLEHRREKRKSKSGNGNGKK